jgi:hypothetical protein
LTNSKKYVIIQSQKTKKEVKKMFDYLFEDLETGEEFLVQAESKKHAMAIAQENFESPRCYGKVSTYYAESCGLDTY